MRFFKGKDLSRSEPLHQNRREPRRNRSLAFTQCREDLRSFLHQRITSRVGALRCSDGLVQLTQTQRRKDTLRVIGLRCTNRIRQRQTLIHQPASKHRLGGLEAMLCQRRRNIERSRLR